MSNKLLHQLGQAACQRFVLKPHIVHQMLLKSISKQLQQHAWTLWKDSNRRRETCLVPTNWGNAKYIVEAR
jgi:hypothetical protein